MREGGREKGRWNWWLSGMREGGREKGRWACRLSGKRKGEGNNNEGDGSEILEV